MHETNYSMFVEEFGQELFNYGLILRKLIDHWLELEIKERFIFLLSILGTIYLMKIIVTPAVMIMKTFFGSSIPTCVPMYSVRLSEYVATKSDLNDLERRVRKVSRDLRRLQKDPYYERPRTSTKTISMRSHNIHGKKILHSKDPCSSVSKESLTPLALPSSITNIKERQTTQFLGSQKENQNITRKAHPCASILKNSGLQNIKLRKVTHKKKTMHKVNNSLSKGKSSMSLANRKNTTVGITPQALQNVKLRPISNKENSKPQIKNIHSHKKSNKKIDTSTKKKTPVIGKKRKGEKNKIDHNEFARVLKAKFQNVRSPEPDVTSPEWNL